MFLCKESKLNNARINLEEIAKRIAKSKAEKEKRKINNPIEYAIDPLLQLASSLVPGSKVKIDKR